MLGHSRLLRPSGGCCGEVEAYALPSQSGRLKNDREPCLWTVATRSSQNFIQPRYAGLCAIVTLANDDNAIDCITV